MTSKPRLTSATPDNEDENSLIALHDDLVGDRAKRRFAIVEFFVPEVIDKTGGDIIPKISLAQIEVIGDGAQLDQVLSIRNAHYASRTGHAVGQPKQPDTPLDGWPDDVGDARDGDAPAVDPFDAAAPQAKVTKIK